MSIDRISKADLENAVDRLDSIGREFALGLVFVIRYEHGQAFVTDRVGNQVTTRGSKREVFEQVQTIARAFYAVQDARARTEKERVRSANRVD